MSNKYVAQKVEPVVIGLFNELEQLRRGNLDAVSRYANGCQYLKSHLNAQTGDELMESLRKTIRDHVDDHDYQVLEYAYAIRYKSVTDDLTHRRNHAATALNMSASTVRRREGNGIQKLVGLMIWDRDDWSKQEKDHAIHHMRTRRESATHASLEYIADASTTAVIEVAELQSRIDRLERLVDTKLSDMATSMERIASGLKANH